MPPSTWNLPWLNHNSQRAYPLAEWATKQDTTDSITIPDSFIVGLQFPVHAGLAVEPDKFYLKQLGIYTNGFTIGIAYNDGADYPLVATVNITKASHTTNKAYWLVGTGDYADSRGQIQIGNLDEINTVAPGEYTFAPADGALEVDTIRPCIRGITSVTLVNGLEETEAFYGDLQFIAGSNFRITPTVIGGQPTQIRFDAVSGEGLNDDCDCEDDTPPIKTINGLGPRADGAFFLNGDDCLIISSASNGLDVTDACSQPCCGCTELQSLKDQLQGLADGALTVKNFVNALTSKVETMNSTVLGSKLNDSGCVSC